jgi:hypothetical protein
MKAILPVPPPKGVGVGEGMAVGVGVKVEVDVDIETGAMEDAGVPVGLSEVTAAGEDRIGRLLF